VRRGTYPPSLSPALRLLPPACRDGLVVGDEGGSHAGGPAGRPSGGAVARSAGRRDGGRAALHRRRLRQPGREAGGRPPRRGGDAPRETQARRLPARPASGPRRRVRCKIFVSAFFVRV
jgi:hypothetical protein